MENNFKNKYIKLLTRLKYTMNLIEDKSGTFMNVHYSVSADYRMIMYIISEIILALPVALLLYSNNLYFSLFAFIIIFPVIQYFIFRPLYKKIEDKINSDFSSLNLPKNINLNETVDMVMYVNRNTELKTKFNLLYTVNLKTLARVDEALVNRYKDFIEKYNYIKPLGKSYTRYQKIIVVKNSELYYDISSVSDILENHLDTLNSVHYHIEKIAQKISYNKYSDVEKLKRIIDIYNTENNFNAIFNGLIDSLEKDLDQHNLTPRLTKR